MLDELGFCAAAGNWLCAALMKLLLLKLAMFVVKEAATCWLGCWLPNETVMPWLKLEACLIHKHE